MRLAVVVPVKSPREAKSRLAVALSPEARVTLSTRLYERTMTVVERWGRADRRLIVSGDAKVLAVAAQRGWVAVREEVAGLNGALTQAAGRAVREGADSLLILPTDLPLLGVVELDKLVSYASRGHGVVISPCRHGDGTNALFLRPPRAIPFSFGPGSFSVHRRLAAQNFVPCAVYYSPILAMDLDTPADWRVCRVLATVMKITCQVSGVR